MSTVNSIGLDIGSASIRAVEAVRIKDRTQIEHFGIALLPPGTVVGGVIKDDRAVTAVLRQLWATVGFQQKQVVLGVSHQQVVVREVEVANVGAKEMRTSLPFQVRDALPLPVDDAVLDFYPLEKKAKRDTVRGLLIAVPRDPVINAVRTVERAGLSVTRVDLACFAALRAAAHLAGDVEAVIDIGAGSTNIVIHQDGVPQIVRSVPRGSAEITKLLATRFSLSQADAEKLKYETGLDDEENPSAAEVVNEAARPLVNEISSSLAYFAKANPEHRVARLALVGGGAMLRGLPARLSQLAGVPVFISDPLQRITDGRRGGKHAALGRIAPSAAVSIGLALGAA